MCPFCHDNQSSFNELLKKNVLLGILAAHPTYLLFYLKLHLKSSSVMSSAAAQPLIISEQAEGTSEISVLNNHTQDLTPNEMMRESHGSRQISAACFALALNSPPQTSFPSQRHTHSLTHNTHTPARCPLHLWASPALTDKRRIGREARRAARESLDLTVKMMKIHLLETCWRRTNMEGRLGADVQQLNYRRVCLLLK